MIAASYTMNLYCDHVDHPRISLIDDMGEYVGDRWAQVAREARKDGWWISRDKNTAVCPACNAKEKINAKA